ncbi:MAG: dockerin type I domain-containing protein, partial [Thiohalocapsa sp.]
RYTPYGVAQPQLLGDIDADGDVDTDDAAIIASAIGEDFYDTSSGAPTPQDRADADLNLDGAIDNLDLTIVSGAIGDTAPIAGVPLTCPPRTDPFPGW